MCLDSMSAKSLYHDLLNELNCTILHLKVLLDTIVMKEAKLHLFLSPSIEIC